MDISYPVAPAQASTHTAASLVLVQIPWPLPALLGDAVVITHLRTLTIRSPPPSFPYIPGLLAFRELGPLLHLLSLLEDEERPDVLLCDGQGIAHPARCGLASHLGVLTGLPSIGSAKSWFFGRLSEDEDDDRQEGGHPHHHHRPTFPNLGHHRGSRLPLYYSNSTFTATATHQQHQRREPISHVLRSQPGINPIFVSPGHRFTLNQASQLVLALCTKYRLPDPIRMADHSSREALREWAAEAQRTETEDKTKDAQGEMSALLS
ncbi:unnamed protein product [Tilletia controversa]|uniref:Endonuclease V n=3 Tax=Tilletia TaxID=13289 RepID=A0A8X7SVY7_9BASI|nr:hypothetical protein CF336_g3916 [Tilletia laevis]KAE8196788.1 hypothetical protein CF328_g4037 [Tilletia controversa]KAE8260122.1 hypothetical protein A4X03_0g3912 [Tilletia caries]KAE8201413.1 hypothetical protein CF335_g3742 [Tilletia laevis]KAE8246423.1 hypothetical protein A4X06_0g5024 [Tilletia controversa]